MSIQYPSTPGVTPTGSIYNDGSGVYGSATLTFNGSTAYDTNDLTLDASSTKKVQTNKFGVPTKQFALPEVPTGSCNVIIPANNSTLPVPGSTFTVDLFGTGMTWFTDKVGLPYKKDDFLIVALNFSQKIN